MPRPKKLDMPTRTKPLERGPVKVRCIVESVWTAGGYLSKNDEGVVSYDRAQELLKAKQVEVA